MKPFITGLLKGRITRRSLLAAVLPTAGASLAWAGGAPRLSNCDGQCKLGGSWIGTTEDGYVLSHVQIPLDPDGKTAAVKVGALTYSQLTAGIAAAAGADSQSDYVGQMAMVNRDTANGTILGYAIASGNPPVIKLMVAVRLISRFTAPDVMVCDWTFGAYLPTADYLPHGDPLPPGWVPGATLTFKRVPLW